MVLIGITGPTGAGKTTLLREVEALGGAVIDCDAVYHELLEHDPILQHELERRFGPLRGENGSIDRKRLGAIVFGDPEKLAQLNAVAQTATVDRTRALVEECRRQGRALAAIDAIALVESGLDRLCSATVAVTAPPEVRVRRIMAREGIPEDYAWSRVRAQKPEEYFRGHCGHVLVNDCASAEEFSVRAKALLQTMIRAASAGEEVHGVKERVAAAATEDTEESWNTPHPNMLFSNYLEFWLQWKRKSWEEVTYSGYCQNVRSWIAPYFSARKVRLNEITVLDIEMFYTHEINKRGVSGNTVLHYHANIRKALSDAVKLKLIPYNPAAEVERPKKDNFVASYYSADELMEVLPIFANTKMELPVMLAAFYGLRRSEVIGLQWSAIDFERKIVTISRTFERINVDGKMVDVSKCRTKNKSSFRSLPLIPAVEQALLKAQKRQRQQMKLCGNSYCKEYKDYICVDDMGHLVTPDYVTRVFREMLLKNGFRPIRYHDLRHSCASLLIKNKVTMKEVQMWLGHSSFSTTANIYAHIDVDSKMEAANMIASKINLGELPEKKKSPKRKIA